MDPKLHRMSLHDIISLDNGITVLRVPGFWIYTFPSGASEKIPFSNEFSEEKDNKVTKEKAAKIIAEYYSLPKDFYKQSGGSGNSRKAKKILACILHHNSRLNHFDIAVFMERKNHSSSITAIKNLKNEMMWNDKLKNEYDEILKKYFLYKIIQ